jgi:ribose transport system substrate-binding protein
MFKTTKSRFYLVPVLMRALDILELLSRTPTPLKMGEISLAVDLSPTTTYRILQTLVQRGYLAQDLEERFTVVNRPGMNSESPTRPAN